MTQLKVNGQSHTVNAAAGEPLLYVLGNDLELAGPRFGCGLAQCGSCSVLVEGLEMRSCVTTLAQVGTREVTTLEGLPRWQALRQGKHLDQGAAVPLHPVQQALIDVAAPQCGYCMNGMAIKAAELLSHNSHPTEAQVRTALNGHLCRCGTYPRIIQAVLQAAAVMRKAKA